MKSKAGSAIEGAYIELWKNGRTQESIGQDLMTWVEKYEGSRAVASFLAGDGNPRLLGLYKKTKGRGDAQVPAPVDPVAVTSFLSGWAAPEGTEKDGLSGYPKRVRRSKDSMVMILIPAGTFQMGAVPGQPDRVTDPDDKPRHAVTLSRAYYLDETEVTVGMWRKFAAESGVETPNVPPESSDMYPMSSVSWDDVQGYLTWARVVLPTEAQWERAARGGRDGEIYPWGKSDDVNRRNGYGKDDGFEGLAPVKAFAPNDFGLYDMSGNVMQWCADAHGAYDEGDQRDPIGPPFRGYWRVLRGGSWTLPDGATASDRGRGTPHKRFAMHGFRCAKTLP
jgi:sulfatase modifying factor 1